MIQGPHGPEEEALKKRWGAVPEHVFSSTEGGMMNKCSYRRWIEKAPGKAGIERTRLHNLRHSAISPLLNSGADPFAVQKLAGHSDVRPKQHLDEGRNCCRVPPGIVFIIYHCCPNVECA